MTLAGRTFGARFLQVCDQAIAQLHRVAKALHTQRIGRNAGQPEEIRVAAKRQHKLVVPEPVIVAVEAVRDSHLRFSTAIA